MPSVFVTVANLVREGPILPVRLGMPRRVREALATSGRDVASPILVDALVDTGADCTCVSPDVASRLALVPYGAAEFQTPSGTARTSTYYLCLEVPNGDPSGAVAVIDPIAVLEGTLQGADIDCLIGRDVLKHSVLTYIGRANCFNISF